MCNYFPLLCWLPGNDYLIPPPPPPWFKNLAFLIQIVISLKNIKPKKFFRDKITVLRQTIIGYLQDKFLNSIFTKECELFLKTWNTEFPKTALSQLLLSRLLPGNYFFPCAGLPCPHFYNIQFSKQLKWLFFSLSFKQWER